MTKEKEEPATMVRGVPWALWLSSGLVIALLLFSTVMLMVTMYSGVACSKPTDSTSEFRPLVRLRSTTTVSDEPSDTATDEEVQQKISELFKRKGYSNPDPDPEDQLLEESGSQIEARIDPPRRRRTRRPLQKIGKDFDASQSYVIKHANGTITYVFPKEVLKGNGNAQLVADTTSEDSKKAAEENVVRYRTPSSNSSDIVFPSDSEPPTSDQVTPQKKESCSPEFPICNNVDNYPHNKINDIVAKYKQQYAGVFGEDVVVPEGDALVTRFDTSNDRPLCYSVERLIHPQEGFTKDKINLTIVNTKEYKQGVRVELCSNPAQTCNELDGLMGQYRTECKQLYHYRTLLAVHPKTGELYKESFKLPSCCKCVIKPLTLLSDGK
ncbi:protein spaetzle isoform X1 [Culex quinquefasciatus]|uniref:protein spaetzle isoform X1 n=1 Tax=Culex quinquefasciatus TaxID=7176 RepID=UPI0018E29640|nr:protein spaetzle isoform X1 [Culex quinquefasciatus]XP_038109629.1 protein spaetzle isoform X1 [Culex quinquefasciatus]XP_038109632.1 protein spaetzle isoform X1 [Culex quinquefasciatus]XP_038109640.1 protein spaetzle isoform X1 [Culex quinquefasciatus]XP_038109650.1 protein spaetzle isoform X1 [Culex quinquefasciatus]XP_038109658.1 protein spaetzle isoform X1 [Culex quinquefasciatus]XP_038109663.1 protein spaetzle isoform X1 [Culex quinquefasciatus]XP_038109665.1 protein spaetzle isoform